MDTDNLQELWQSQQLTTANAAVDSTRLKDSELKIAASNKRLLRNLILEITAGIIIYVGAGLLLFFLKASHKEVLFALKIILLTALHAVPSTILLYQAITKLKDIDYTLPLKEYLQKRINNLKKSVRLYWLTGIFACLLILIALFTDKFYLAQSLWLQTGGLIYVLVMAVLLSPVLRYQYGREIKYLEKQIQEFENVQAPL